MDLFSHNFRRRMSPAPNARPRLEELEGRDVPSYLEAEFPGYGVWRCQDNGTWQQLTTADATQVAADRTGNVVGQFPGHGIWLYSNSTKNWQQINTLDSSTLAIGEYYFEIWQRGTYFSTIIHNYVAAEFPGGGVWLFDNYTLDQQYSYHYNSASWTQLTPSSASAVAVDANGHVVAEFPGYGVWLYGQLGNGPWYQLTTSDARSLANAAALFGSSLVVAEFPGYGVWRWSDYAGWQQLTASDATAVGITATGDVTAAFGGAGVWSYLDSSNAAAAGRTLGWSQLTPADAYAVGIDINFNVYGAFRGWGVWYDQAGTWRHFSPSDPTSFSVGQ
jgi:hypothetical protein